MTTKLCIAALFILSYNPGIFASYHNIPFRMAGKLIIVEAMVNGERGNFILDTGTSELVLNSRYATGVEQEKIFKGVNGRTGKIQTDYVNFELGNLKWKSVYAEIIPLEHLERIKGIPIQGLIGSKLLRLFELIIDLKEMKMDIIRASHKDPMGSISVPPLAIMPLRLKGASPVIQATLGQETLNLMIDTGAEYNLIDKKHNELLQVYLSNPTERLISSFAKTDKKVVAGKLAGMRIGANNCQAMNTFLMNLSDLNRTLPGPKIDGILGFEWLKQYKVSINFKQREVRLWHSDKSLIKNDMAIGN